MLQHGSIALRLYFKLATARDELSVSRKVTETSLCRSSKAWKVNAMRPSETGQTKLSDKDWRDLIRRTQRQKRKSVLLRCLSHLPHYLRCRRFFSLHVSGRKGGFSHQECSLRRFDLMNKRVLPLTFLKYCPWTRIDVEGGLSPNRNLAVIVPFL
jgi:hypothetical protein